MDFIHRAVIEAYHRERIKKHGNGTLKSVGWLNEEMFEKRNELLLAWADLNHSSILDLGCGYGSTLQYIDAHYDQVAYYGVDLMPEFIDEAKQRFAGRPQTSFQQADFSTDETPITDFVLVCGAFSYDAPNGLDHHIFYRKMMKHFYDQSRKGLIMSVLRSDTYEGKGTLITWDVPELKAFCEEISDGNCQFRTSPELPFELNIFLKKP